MIHQRPRRKVIFSAVLALTFLGLFFRLDYNANTNVIDPISADAASYLRYAMNLIEHRVFSQQPPFQGLQPDHHRTPGYPFFLVPIIALSDVENIYTNILLIQALLGALLVPLTYLVARFLMPFWPSMMATSLVLLSPHLISIGGYMLSETLFAVLFLASLYLFLAARKHGRPQLYAASGLAFGATYLVTPSVLIIPWFLTFIYFLERPKGTPRPIVPIAIFCLAFSAFWMGYGVRNHLTVSAENSGGRVLMSISHGAYPDFIYKDKRYQYFMYHEDPAQPQIANDVDKFIEVFMKRVKAEPWKYIRWYVYGKTLALWNWNIYQGQGDVFIYPVEYSIYDRASYARLTHAFMKIAHPVILLLAIAATLILTAIVVRSRTFPENSANAMIVASIPVCYTLAFIVFAPWPRYSVPLRPELFITATWALYFLFNLLSSEPFRTKFLPSSKDSPRKS